jgi:hypothetical protein
MLGTTFVLGLAAGSKTLPLINQSKDYQAEYYLRESLASYRVSVRHSNVTKAGVIYDRHNIEVLITVFAAGAVPEFTRKSYVVVERLPGDTYTDDADALSDWLIASANANLVKLLNWES